MGGHTCSTLFGPIAATGLRISEAIGLDVGGAFGSKKYAFEELVAEMNAAFCRASLSIVPTVGHADHISSRLEVQRENSRPVVRAASQASKAAGLILGFLPDIESADTAQEAA